MSAPEPKWRDAACEVCGRPMRVPVDYTGPVLCADDAPQGGPQPADRAARREWSAVMLPRPRPGRCAVLRESLVVVYARAVSVPLPPG